jgi:hypothetical protein
MTQTLDHVVVVHILIWDKRKSQINEYSDPSKFINLRWRGCSTLQLLYVKGLATTIARSQMPFSKST